MRKQVTNKALSSNKYQNKPKLTLDQYIKQLKERLDIKFNKLRKELDIYGTMCQDKVTKQQRG